MFDLNLDNPAPAPKFQLLESVVVSVQPQRIQGMFFWDGSWKYWLSGSKIYFPENMLNGNDFRKIFKPCKVRLAYEIGSWVIWHDRPHKIIGARYTQNDWYFVVRTACDDWKYVASSSLTTLIK